MAKEAKELGLPGDAPWEAIDAKYAEPDVEGSNNLDLPNGVVATRSAVHGIFDMLENAESAYRNGISAVDNSYNPYLKANIQELEFTDAVVDELTRLGISVEKKGPDEHEMAYRFRVMNAIRANKGSNIFASIPFPVVLNESRKVPANWHDNEFILFDVIFSLAALRKRGFNENTTKEQATEATLDKNRAIFNRPDAGLEVIAKLTRQMVAGALRAELDLPDDVNLLQIHQAFYEALSKRHQTAC